MNWLNHIGVGKKIAMGFGLTTAVMLLMMCVVNWRIDANNTLNARVIDLRQPTVIASTRLLNGVNQSLAGLRGYMILGKDSFKAERADGWREINDAVADLDRYAQGWTNADNVERLARIKQSLTAFAQAQREIEDISQTPDNTPATRILVTQAAPLAKVMIAEITTMIDIEAAQPATAERKALLGMMADVRGSTGMALANIRAFLLTGDDAFRHDYNTFWTRNEQRFADLSRKRGLLTGAQRDAFDKFSQARDAFKGLPPQMFEIRSGEAWNLANLWLGTKAAPEAAKIKGWLGEMVEDQRGLANTDSTAARQSMDNLKVALFALGALALGLAVAIAWGITRMITRPLAQMLAALEEIADGDGDLTRRLDERRADEIGAVAVAFNRFTDKIRGVVVQVSAAASAIGHGTQEMATGNADLSQRTEEQASALEETASSMEQMTANVRQSADNAAKANQMAVGARSQAEHGGRVVADAVAAMAEVEAASRKISEIIGMVGEIAFQTNLLALNASVEAARAGEQGRGFAVVASEVRNLAQRSATAAGDIRTLIDDTVTKVHAGAKLVETSGTALNEIIASINKVSDMVGEINAASQEQAHGIEQVNTAILQMDEVTQQNAALVEEAAAVSESLATEANNLSRLMTFFKVGGPSPATAPLRPVAQATPATATPAHAGFVSKARQAPKPAAPAPQPVHAVPAGDDGMEDF